MEAALRNAPPEDAHVGDIMDAPTQEVFTPTPTIPAPGGVFPEGFAAGFTAGTAKVVEASGKCYMGIEIAIRYWKTMDFLRMTRMPRR